MKISQPGVYDLSSEEYHSDPCAIPSLSQGMIKDLIWKSPAHVWVNSRRLNPEWKPEDKIERFDLGLVAHSMLLEGADIANVIAASDWRKKESQEFRDQARKEGKIPLLLDQYKQVVKMVSVAHKAIYDCDELRIGSLKMQGDSEQSYFWSEDGSWLRARLDWIAEEKDIILDYKSTVLTANPNDLARQIVAYGYDIQAAFYTRAAKAIHRIEPKFIFLFQETAEPYGCSFIGLPPDFLEMGKSKVEYGIKIWESCLEKDEWPSYPNQVAWINLPAWAAMAWETRAAEIAI